MIQRPRVNHEIKAAELRIISSGGENLGIKSLVDALKLAEGFGLDLIEIAPTAQPPVARIMDRGKYQYQLEKEARKSRKKTKEVELRGIRVRLGTGAHDLTLKAKKAEEFLTGGDRVQIQLTLRGREKALDRKFIEERIHKILDTITVPFKITEGPKQGPRGLLITIEPDYGKNKQISSEKNQGNQNGQNPETVAAPKPL